MGLTIHYHLATDCTDVPAIRSLVQEFRRLAQQLPFQAIGDLIEFQGDECRDDDHDDPHRWLKIQAGHFLGVGESFVSVAPLHVIAFTTIPGEGSEPANIGLALYPETIAVAQGSPTRRARTNLTGWHWKTFCKTQYASNPEYGGVTNFVRCHLSVIGLLDAIKHRQLATVEVRDESNYWIHRDPRQLAEVVGEWNAMVAAVAGQFKDATGGVIQAPITEFPNFEHLEAQGQDLIKKPSS